MTKKHLRYTLAVLTGIAAGAASLVVLRPRPTWLMMTPRPGDDTVVINQTRSTRLSASLIDQYGRRLRSAC